MSKVHLLCIDPQVDFCSPTGALSVAGADQDMERLAAFLNKNQKRIDDIHVTLDSHLPLHIAHGALWIDPDGKHPNPFTLISAEDVRNGKFRTVAPLIVDDGGERKPWAQKYTEQLESNKRFVLCIWPEHCLIGSAGAAVYPAFHDALNDWQKKRIATVNYIAKGSNMLTEHYSAVKADVEIHTDPTTQLDVGPGSLIGILQDPEVADILITGEALSHCVANTIVDIADSFGEENVKKFVLLEDTSSSVTGFEQQGLDFVKEMVARGMRKTTTLDY